jgi:ABC-type Fe3+/spermidine/putrescine transport system ATPase subunit
MIIEKDRPLSIAQPIQAEAEHMAEAPTPEADTVLRFENVRKSYGDFLAVKSSSFTLQKGEILTLLGPSGCGKTTTLRMAIGLERATEGRIHFQGKLVDGAKEGVFYPPEKRDMGMVFQSYAIWPHMNVFENVAYPLKARRRPAAEIREAVSKVLDLVGLKGFEKRPSTLLSGGQQQRVAVSRALVFGPDLLLMDEPFSNLDAKLRDQMRTEVKLLQRRLGISILFVTHDQSEALALSDRLAVMRDGVVEQIGAPQELYNNPGTAAVRDFLGRTVLLPGRILERDAQGRPWVALEEGGRVRIGGMVHHDCTPGSPCVVGVRPEQVNVTVGEAPSALAPGQVPGLVLALLFLGDRYEATLQLPSGKLITVLLPATSDWREGQKVAIALPESRLHLWPTETAPS